MPVLSLAKKVVKGMKASPVRVGEVVQAVDAQAAGSSSTQYCIFISYRLCESRLLAPSGHRRCKSHTTSSRNMRCRVFALGKAQDDTTASAASLRHIPHGANVQLVVIFLSLSHLLYRDGGKRGGS